MAWHWLQGLNVTAKVINPLRPAHEAGQRIRTSWAVMGHYYVETLLKYQLALRPRVRQEGFAHSSVSAITFCA